MYCNMIPTVVKIGLAESTRDVDFAAKHLPGLISFDQGFGSFLNQRTYLKNK